MLIDLKETESKKCTVMKYGETFYGHYKALNISYSEIKSIKVALRKKEHIKELK